MQKPAKIHPLKVAATALLALACLGQTQAQSTSTLDRVISSQVLRCGVQLVPG